MRKRFSNGCSRRIVDMRTRHAPPGRLFIIRISDAGELEPVRTLSREWGQDLKPFHQQTTTQTVPMDKTIRTTQPAASADQPRP